MSGYEKLLTYIKLAIMLPGTFLHELAHLFGALLFAKKITGFTIIPDLDNNAAGGVSYIPRYGAGTIIINAMPKIWWLVLFQASVWYGLISFSGLDGSVEFTLHTQAIDFSHGASYIFLYFAIQLTWAGGLSFTDWSNIIGGLFTVTGSLFITAIFLVYKYLSEHDMVASVLYQLLANSKLGA